MRGIDDGRQGLLQGLIGDGRPLLSLGGVILVLAGTFALFQSANGQFLPHDEQFLGMTADELCQLQQCRIVHFMIHDRVAFGGSLIAIGSLYLWLVAFPLSQRQAWAWWVLLVSGVIGFGSFLTYLGYGYLDTWHAAATIPLLLVFGWGLLRTRAMVDRPADIRSLGRPSVPLSLTSVEGIGRICLLLTAAALVAGGGTIAVVGMTHVFVPQDLEFMGLSAAELHAVNPRLVPLIAHDRAGFGGGLCSTGITVFFCVWCGTPSRSLWQVLAFAGGAGFATAVGIHPVIGYNSVSHLAPAVVAALIFIMGLALSFRSMYWSSGVLPAKPCLHAERSARP